MKIVVTGDRARYLSEGLLALKDGKGTTSKVLKLQLRPHPLAR